MGALLLMTVSAGTLMFVPVRDGGEPRLADAPQRLTSDEEKAVRSAVYGRGAAHYSPDDQPLPIPRRLATPKAVEAAYSANPRATARLLLAIVEGGRPVDSIHAAACLHALAESPEIGALVARSAREGEWDEVVSERLGVTFREVARRVCIRLIAKKDAGGGGKR